MKIDIYNQIGEKIGQTKLPSEIFNVKLNSDLVHQVVVSQMANRRQGTAQVKDRGDVRGGGKKPWRQKGTGRARHGSIRSPIWKGGGVTFGPNKEKNYKRIIPKKIRRKALFMVLSEKVKNGLVWLLDRLELEEAKTREMAKILKTQNAKRKVQNNSVNFKDKKKKEFKKSESVLIVLPRMDEKIIRAAKNIPKIATIQAKDLNCLDLLNYKYLLMPEQSIDILKTTFLEDKR